MRIGVNIVKFTANNDWVYLSKPDNICSGKVAEENKSNMIEGLNNFQTVEENK